MRALRGRKACRSRHLRISILRRHFRPDVNHLFTILTRTQHKEVMMTLIRLLTGLSLAPSCRRMLMLKFLVVTGTSLGMLTAAVAADYPRPQPVYTQAPVGKAPIGKYPVGKAPYYGKAPTPIVTKG